MKTQHIILKLTAIATFILITVFLTHAQGTVLKNDRGNNLAMTSYPKADNDMLASQGIYTISREYKNLDNLADQSYHISDALFEKQGLLFDVTKTIAVSSLPGEFNNDQLPTDKIINRFFDRELRFDLSKTNSVIAVDNEACNQITIASEKLIRFDVGQTKSVQDIQNQIQR